MTLTIDLSAFQAAVARVGAAAQASVEQHLEEAALRLVLEAPYGEPDLLEEGPGPALEQLITPVETSGTVSSIGVITVYDWVQDPEKQHCFSPEGLDCSTFARKGPYLWDTRPADPGDGTTPCGANCGCELVPRELDLSTLGDDVLTQLGLDVGRDLTQAWNG